MIKRPDAGKEHNVLFYFIVKFLWSIVYTHCPHLLASLLSLTYSPSGFCIRGALSKLTVVSMLPNTMANGHFSVSIAFDFWVPLFPVKHSLLDYHPLWYQQNHALPVFPLAHWLLLPSTCCRSVRLLYPGTSSFLCPRFLQVITYPYSFKCHLCQSLPNVHLVDITSPLGSTCR